MDVLQVHQTQHLKMLVETPPLRRPKGSLTASAQMPGYSITDKRIHRSHRHTGIAKRKVIGPPLELKVHFSNQMWQRNMTPAAAEHFPQIFPLCLHGLFRGGDIQIPKIATSKISVVSEGKSQKIDAGSGLPKIYGPRFLPVQFQIKPGLNLCLDKIAHPASLIPGQNHQIIRIADYMRLGPVTGTVGGVEDLLEPVKVNIRQKWRNDSANAKDNFEFFRVIPYQRSWNNS
jgi:hypothetical protein